MSKARHAPRLLEQVECVYETLRAVSYADESNGWRLVNVKTAWFRYKQSAGACLSEGEFYGVISLLRADDRYKRVCIATGAVRVA